MNIEEALEILISAAKEEALTQKFEEEFERYDEILRAVEMVENYEYNKIENE